MRKPCPTDLSDAEWNYIEPHLPAPKAHGRPRTYDLREILNAVFYLLKSGCQWRLPPHDFPRWPTVYHYFRKWRIDGTWERINRAIRERLRVRLGRDPQPSAGVVDSQSVKSSAVGGEEREAVEGIHVYSPNVRPAGGGFFETNPSEDFTQEEREYLFWELGYLQQRFPYAQIQASSPQTLAYAQMDSPVGQAAWILEKFQRWTDESAEKTPDEIFGMDRLLTAVMVYLVTDSFDTSLWAYPGVYLDPPTLEPGQRVEAPVGLVACADPLVPVPPRSFVERAYNVARWTDMPEAGHFAAFQRPGPVVEDLRAFLRQIRSGP